MAKKPAVVKKPKVVKKNEPIKIGSMYEFAGDSVHVIGKSVIETKHYIVEDEFGNTYTVDPSELMPYNGQKKRNEGHTEGLDWATEVIDELLGEVKYRTKNNGTDYGRGYFEGMMDAIQTCQSQWTFDKLMKEE